MEEYGFIEKSLEKTIKAYKVFYGYAIKFVVRYHFRVLKERFKTMLDLKLEKNPTLVKRLSSIQSGSITNSTTYQNYLGKQEILSTNHKTISDLKSSGFWSHKKITTDELVFLKSHHPSSFDHLLIDSTSVNNKEAIRYSEFSEYESGQFK